MNELNFIRIDSSDIYETVITALENGCGELYPGDERRIYGEALVMVVVALFNSINDACRQRLLRYARNDVLDALGETRGVVRQTSVCSTTTERFSVSTAIGDNIVIPQGTRVTCDYVRYFATDKTVVLPAGSLYVDVTITAMEGGESYNDVLAGAINVLVDQIPYIDKVENVSKTSGGSDKETDDVYRERIRTSSANVSVAGPAAAYKYWAMAADPTIADAVVESPGPGVVMITPIGYGGQVPDDEILAKVLKSCSADDVRPLTDKVQVQPPSVEEYDIELTYYTTAANESKCVNAIEGDGGAIDQYIFWQGSALNRDINPDYLRKLILAPNWIDDLVGADRVDIVSPVYRDLNKTTVAKFSGSIRVSHIVEEE
ncbi:MAG: baseplate J/gp47 family protein [Blautia sp.]|nr:baseplate J/gp47 family protein [Blautia sp.]